MDENKLIQELINRYVAVSFQVSKKAEALIKEQIGNELTNDQHYILRYVYQAGECTSTELAEAFEVNKSAITAIINRMVERQLIERARDSSDRRVVYLTVSKEGKELFEKTEEKIRTLVESFITRFKMEEIEGFIHTYEKLAVILAELKKEQQGDSK